ncbi:hypothetical protein Tco_0742965 [Tanacetum coccineum]
MSSIPKVINEKFPLEYSCSIAVLNACTPWFAESRPTCGKFRDSTGCQPSRKKILQSVKHYFWEDPFLDIHGANYTSKKKSLDSGSFGPQSKKKQNSFLVAVDYLSKWVEAKALPTNDARVVDCPDYEDSRALSFAFHPQEFPHHQLHFGNPETDIQEKEQKKQNNKTKARNRKDKVLSHQVRKLNLRD